jgi:uncharacterized membrane protein
MLLKYFLKDFEMVPVAPVTTGGTFVFTFHMLIIVVVVVIIIIIIITITTTNHQIPCCTRRHGTSLLRFLQGFSDLCKFPRHAN